MTTHDTDVPASTRLRLKDPAFEGIGSITQGETAPIGFSGPAIGAPIRRERAKGPTPYRHFGKRVLDVTLVLLSLPASFVIILLCAIALWIESGLPFYTQKRIGAGGRVFSIFKLRTMTRDADATLEAHLAQNPAMRREWNETQKLKSDPRVTRLGQLLRSTSLDELPQLINVLKGDMSLVGPRPMMLDQLDMYGNPIAYYALKPGITGIWQTSARNEKGFAHRNEVDALYLRSVSLKTDLAILTKTVGVVLRRTGY